MKTFVASAALARDHTVIGQHLRLNAGRARVGGASGESR